MIFISGNVPSSKNSKRIARTKHGTFVFNSKFTEAYIKGSTSQWASYRSMFYQMIKNKPKPYRIEFKFIRETKHRFDFVNLLQCPLDMMVKFNWLEDDDYTNVVPVINPIVCFDKHNPGLEINVL